MCAPESLVRVVLEGTSSLLLATLSQCFGGHLSRRNEPGNPLGDLVHVYYFCERKSLLYHICLFCLVSLFFFFFFFFTFCISYHDLSFGTLSLNIHMLVHYASVYARM